MKRDYEREKFESELAAEGEDARIIRITCDRKHKAFWAHLMWEIDPGRWEERLTVADADADEAMRLDERWSDGDERFDQWPIKGNGNSLIEHFKRQPAQDFRVTTTLNPATGVESMRLGDHFTYTCAYNKCSNDLQLTDRVNSQILARLADNGVHQISIDGLREACERHMRNTR